MKNLQKSKVAIIGGGPAGLAAAKSLLEDGLTPVLLEQSSGIGGQWNQGAAHSGIWPELHANSCHIKMAFSDFDHPAGTQMFPSNQEVLAYLSSYARHFGLAPYLRLNTRVEHISRSANGSYLVRSTTAGEASQEEEFSHVIVASGRYNKPRLPRTPGLDQFQGWVAHSFGYRGRHAYRGQRVLVVGNSISGLEIASDLARNEDTVVISSSRKPRYIVKKMLHGKPTENLVFTRFAAYINQVLPPAQAAAGLKEMVLANYGNPADFGGLRPADNILEAGISQCQHYLDYVAAGRIKAVPGVQAYTPTSVVFTDGSEQEIDAVILATGYDLNLPFLSEDIRRTVNADHNHLDLHHFTFHPGLPNMAFTGLFPQIGAYFPTVELQARWIAACWSGVRELPSPEEMALGLAEFGQFKQYRREITCQETLEMFSHNLGVAPSLDKYPELTQELFFGLLAPAQFRLEGHGRQPDARARFEQASRHFTNGEATPLDAQQLGSLQMLAGALPQHQALQALVQQLAV
jgi:dimethylaniline monooxygenase (N-oxide forming)